MVPAWAEGRGLPLPCQHGVCTSNPQRIRKRPSRTGQPAMRCIPRPNPSARRADHLRMRRPCGASPPNLESSSAPRRSPSQLRAISPEPDHAPACPGSARRGPHSLSSIQYGARETHEPQPLSPSEDGLRQVRILPPPGPTHWCRLGGRRKSILPPPACPSHRHTSHRSRTARHAHPDVADAERTQPTADEPTTVPRRVAERLPGDVKQPSGLPVAASSTTFAAAQ